MLIIDCRNLIGDTIYLIKPLQRFLSSQQSDQIALAVDGGLPGDIVRRSFPQLRVDRMEILEAAWPDAERITLSARAAWEHTRSDNGHISLGYSRVLGADSCGGIEPAVDWLPSPGPEQAEYIALAPFSVSCAVNRGEAPNKTLSEDVWRALLDILRRYGYPFRIICGPSERFSAAMGFAETDYYSAPSVEDLVAQLRRSRFVVGVDTGICHVSSCAGIPTIVLWSEAANLQFIGETWAPRTRIVPIGLPAEFDINRIGPLVQEAVGTLVAPDTTPVPSSELPARPSSVTGGAVFPALDSARFFPERYGPGGLRNWSGHLPFARDLIASLRPRLLVELGTHFGESYFGFCQAVVETGSKSSCYAVDTWRGDSHSLSYGDEVYDDVRGHNSARYAGFSHLLRATFDDALNWFGSGSIDLLHIDGLHTYEAVKHDFEAWYPKVAPDGVVLFHDTVERYADFGVWKLWEEVSATHESFEFRHSHGLGVIRKAGGERGAGGILDYLFVPGNADAIRRYYVLCADRLDAKEAAASVDTSRGEPKNGEAARVYRDPAASVLTALTRDAAAGEAEGEFFSLNVADSKVPKNDWQPVPGKPNTFRALTRDPGATCAAGFDASGMRFFVVVMACSCDEPHPQAQLFWTGPERPGFTELLSIRFPVVADGKSHTYIVDLHAGAGRGAVNHLWWHHGVIANVRFDPMDAPGEFTISVAGFAHQDRLEAAGVRETLRLSSLRSELSDRYLQGSGIEIGALQNPLALRPDAHVRYVDRLTLEQARACFPELDSQTLVNPSIICDAAALDPLADGAVDFVIANHVIEHLKDPLGGLREWLRVVRPGGYLYVAAPEHTNPLDRLRAVTDLDHLVEDFNARRRRSHLDREHYREWVASTRPELSPKERASQEAALVAQGYDIHFHTFNLKTFSGMLGVAGRKFSAEVVELRRSYGTPSNEFIAILRKR